VKKKEESLNGIIKYDNDLADIPLIGFTSTHVNIFMVTCFLYQRDLAMKFKDKETLLATPQEDLPYIEYDLSDFLRACNFKRGGPKKFIEEVSGVRKRLGDIHVDVNMDENKEIGFPFFYVFYTDKENKIFRAQIHKRAAYMLFGIEKNYTQHEIKEFIEIKSIFSKRCYRVLKRWRGVGEWRADIDTFRNTLGIPASYRQCDIDERVLKVINEQLSPYFDELKIEKFYKKGKGSPISSIKISFKKENTKGYRKTNFTCPRCGGPLVEKIINGKTCWCHIDGWEKDAPCNAIFNAVEDILDLEKKKKEENEIENCPGVIINRIKEIF